MTKHTAAPATDPIVTIGERLGASFRAMEQADQMARNASDIGARTPYQRAATHKSDETVILADLLSTQRAQSLPGAAIQIAQAITESHLLAGEVSEMDETEILQSHRKVLRLLYSALAAVEQAGGRTVADMVTPDFAGPWLSPWLDDAASDPADGEGWRHD